MGKPRTNRQWLLPQDCLRQKFWQVAEGGASDQFITPFEAKRVASKLSRSEISERMGLNSSDYANFEAGETHASPGDIVAFCKAVKCQPLDLYIIDGEPETPLPVEIFYSLVDMIEDPDTPETYRRSSWNRLEKEARRARAMVDNFRAELKPLFRALGLPEQGEKIKSLRVIRDARHLMDGALIEYELLLEDRLDKTRQDLALNEKQYAFNNQQLQIKAEKIYGQNAQQAIRGLTTLLVTRNNHENIKAQFKKKPDLFCPLKPGDVLGVGEVAVFFARVKRNLNLFEQNRELKISADDLAKKYKDFKTWSDTPYTFTLLDWYEHYTVVSAIKDINDRKTRTRKSPGPSSPDL